MSTIGTKLISGLSDSLKLEFQAVLAADAGRGVFHPASHVHRVGSSNDFGKGHSFRNKKVMPTKIYGSCPILVMDEFIRIVAFRKCAQETVRKAHQLDRFTKYGHEPFYSTDNKFLADLFDLNSECMTEIVKKHAKNLRNPPMTVSQVLDTLHQHVPTFVQLVRNELHIVPQYSKEDSHR